MTGPVVPAAVLAGGRSTRMGADKALLVPAGGGPPLGRRAVDAARAAGCEPVVVVGGTPEHERVLGAPVVPDLHPGEGPLGGILTALGHFGPGVGQVLVLPCDLPWVTGRSLEPLLDAASLDTGSDLVGAVVDGRDVGVLAVWRTSALAALAAAFEAGERSVLRFCAGLAVGRVATSEALRDADTPADLA